MNAILPPDRTLHRRIADATHAIRCILASPDTPEVRSAKFRTGLVAETLAAARGDIDRAEAAERRVNPVLVSNQPRPERKAAESLAADLVNDLTRQKVDEIRTVAEAGKETFEALRPHVATAIDLATEALETVEAALAPVSEVVAFTGRSGVQIPSDLRKSVPFALAQIRLIRIALTKGNR